MRWTSFIKVAVRNILLHRGFSLVSLIGLSFGIALAFLVLAYVNYETSYDTDYPQSENIYRLISHGRIGDDTISSALTPLPLMAVAADYPGVEACTRMVPGASKLVKSDFASFKEDHFFYVDSGFFNVFRIPLFLGERTHVFQDTNAVVISRSVSRRYFGTRNPVGEQLTLDNGWKLTVSGVFYDLPQNTHLQVDFIANWQLALQRMKTAYQKDFDDWNQNWFALNTYTYLRINESLSPDTLNSYLQQRTSLLSRQQIERMSGGLVNPDLEKMDVNTTLQPITEIHLNQGLDHEIQKGASSAYVSVFTAIALFILIITAINFMNLTTARASRRFREVAVRKTFGAGRRHLIWQFFIESILFCFLALGLALVMMELFFSRFSQLFDIHMGEGAFIQHIDFGWVVLITLLVGIIAGSYPSFFFSGLHSPAILKGQVRPGRSGIIVRGILVAFQICISVALMSVSMAMQGQLQFVRKAPQGYDPENLLAIERAYALGNRADSVKRVMMTSEAVEGISSVLYLPGQETSIMSFKNVTDTSQVVLLATNMVDSMFFETIGAGLIKGRLFSAGDIHDSSRVIINESAAHLLGFTNLENCKLEVIGSGLGSEEAMVLEVIGIVNDIHFESLKQPVRPMVFIQPEPGVRMEHLLIKFREGEDAVGIKTVEAIWKNTLPDEPFGYFKLSENIERFYREEVRFARIGGVLAFLSVIFAILGLIGMVSFVVHSKIKTMRVSRILSASQPIILMGTFRGVSAYVFAGIFSSLLISPFVINYWLSGFYYSFQPSGLCLVVPLIAMSIISMVTIYLVGIKVFKIISRR